MHREKPKVTDWLTVGLSLFVALAAIVSAWVFQGQLTEARKLTAFSEEISKRQFSPYLFYDNGKVNVSKDGRKYIVSIQVKNSGQTPAYSATHWFTAEELSRLSDPFAFFRWDNPNPIVFRKHERQNVADIGPGQSLCIKAEFPLVGSLTDDTIYVWGDVKYRDQFGQCQAEVFVLQTTIPSNGSSLQLAAVMPYAENPAEIKKCSKTESAELRWKEEPRRPNETQSRAFQGACQN